MIYIIIILLFASLVVIHEWGHFFAARRGGVEVEEFGVGFPPRAWGKKIKGTLYSINWLPLGGFVRLKGEDGDDVGPGTFGGASTWVKTKILLAGVGMNFVSAVIILYVLAVTGLPGLGSLEPKFLKPTYTHPPQLVVGSVGKGSPAEIAGVKSGDILLQAGELKPTSEDELANFTKTHAGEKQTFIFKNRTNGERSVEIQLRSPGTTDGYLGVGTQQIYTLRYDPLTALVAAFWLSGALFLATVAGVAQLFWGIPMLIMGLFQTSVPAAAAQASGPIGIVYIFQSALTLGWAYVFLFLANIAAALAAFNILPLPALDGGRLALIWWQKLTGRKISADLEAKIHGYGFMALLGLMVLVSIYDYRKFF